MAVIIYIYTNPEDVREKMGDILVEIICIIVLVFGTFLVLEKMKPIPIKTTPNLSRIYLRGLYQRREEIHQRIGCKPVKSVVEVRTALMETGQYDTRLQRFGNVTLKRCTKENICPLAGYDCIPTRVGPKILPFVIYNDNLHCLVRIFRIALQHTRCLCQNMTKI